MSVIVVSLQGRFGNQTMQWLFAYAFAQRHGMKFRCEEWIGERIFQLPAYFRPDIGAREELPVFSEINLASIVSGPPSFIFRGYAQSQSAMIYTKREAQAWLQFRPDVEAAAHAASVGDWDHPDVIVCHQRRGDYAGYGYPLASQRSYRDACAAYGLDWNHPGMSFLTEEDPTPHKPLHDDLAFVADFYRMVKAPTLLRGNSSFSWLAALLGNGLVLSPVIDGLEGGKEHDCKFVAGNWPRFANLGFVTDLFVRDV